jgi:hypothetical protein
MMHLFASHGQASGISRLDRDRARLAILEEAAIVCATLAFSGGGGFTRLVRKFDVVVVDEAAQAVEPSVLIPLAHGGAKQVHWAHVGAWGCQSRGWGRMGSGREGREGEG